jgi:hypothetical protein
MTFIALDICKLVEIEMHSIDSTTYFHSCVMCLDKSKNDLATFLSYAAPVEWLSAARPLIRSAHHHYCDLHTFVVSPCFLGSPCDFMKSIYGT